MKMFDRLIELESLAKHNRDKWETESLSIYLDDDEKEEYELLLNKFANNIEVEE